MNSASLSGEALVRALDRCLPQTQCTRCDYPRCADYARAMADGEAEINQCPPGGEITISALAEMLERDVQPLNPANGVHEPLRVALIDEPACIGCKLCIKACPVDCIVGSVKLMHTVIARDCTGCELCLDVCPTDCIAMVTPGENRVDPGAPSQWPEFSAAQVERARHRNQQKLERQKAIDSEQEKRRSRRHRASLQRDIQAALQRKRPR